MANYLKGNVLGWRRLDCRYVDGRNWKLLNKDGRFHFRTESGRRLTPPYLFVHDFNSVPRFFERALPRAGDGTDGGMYGPAGVLHDWAYVRGAWDDGTPFDRRTADQIHRAACEALNVSEWRYRVMYRALRMFGGKSWRKHKHPSPVDRR